MVLIVSVSMVPFDANPVDIYEVVAHPAIEIATRMIRKQFMASLAPSPNEPS
jgi:hypothetical protein